LPTLGRLLYTDADAWRGYTVILIAFTSQCSTLVRTLL